jgi:diguanylate cyclase (GGDEF)-like protein
MTKQHQILIVEDDPDTADMLSAYFESQGYQVRTAAWGKDALKVCQRTVPDLIIQDIRLPDIDGYQVVRQLRTNLRTSNVPIIFLTDKRARSDKIAGLELGAVDYLTKPFDMQELRLRVKNALRRASYASLVSPVTGLPERDLVEDKLEGLIGTRRWAVIYVSIVDLDAFSDAYGFVAGDDVLRAVSLILSNVIDEVGTTEDFCGHTTKSSFVLITQETQLLEICEQLASRLERAFNYFYPIKEIESGQIAAPMRAEVGIATASSGTYSDVEAILKAAIASRKTVAAILARPGP